MKPPTVPQLERDMLAASASGNWPEAERLGGQLDHRTHKPPVALGAAALWYAQHGLHVFPIMAGTKEPFPRSHGCKDATTDPDRVRAWWAAAPHANIGIATGHIVDVIDVDGAQGNVTLARELLGRPTPGVPYPGLPPVLGTVLTPRPGGRHLYLAARPHGAHGNLAGLGGIDYRGLGGYVVAPPSRTSQGSYRWLRPLEGL